MITVTRQFTISSGTAPYNYTWTYSNPCMAAQTQTGQTTNGVINATFLFESEACLEAAVLTLTVTDVNGCRATTTFEPTNLCDDLTVGTISQAAGYEFTVTGSTSGCNSVSFSWEYDTALFTLADETSSPAASTIDLTPNPNIVNWPSTSDITVTVTDCKGCVKTETLTFDICQPTALGAAVSLFCTPEQFVSSNFTLPNPTGCPGSTYDWSTVVFSASPFTWNLVSGSTYFLTAPLSLSAGSYTVSYTVKTTEGLRSLSGTITITVVACSDQPIFIPDFNTRIDCDALVGDIHYIDIEDSIVTSDPIDWSTFEVLTSPTPASSSITLTVLLDGRHYIAYEIPALVGVDAFRWTICTTNGDCAFAPVYVVQLECADAPVAVADTACTTCGGTVNISVLDNDTENGSPLLLNSIVISTPAVEGSTVVVGDGTVTYNAPAVYAGTDTFSYTVMDSAGNTSNAATVTVTIICAGIDGSVNICNS